MAPGVPENDANTPQRELERRMQGGEVVNLGGSASLEGLVKTLYFFYESRKDKKCISIFYLALFFF